MTWGDSTFGLTRLCFQRALAFIYCMGFLGAVNQFRGLLGSRGLEPVSDFVASVPFWQSPSLFFWQSSDRFILTCLWIGLIVSVFALTGLSERFGMATSVVTWGLLWILYLSIVNVGQTFYGFGWESILLETGFLAIFLGSQDTPVPTIIIWMLRWLLFRIMFGAGLIKLRGDPCWRDLTCLIYHYETQPIPNPLSWFFHYFPVWVHKLGTLFTHFVELIVPWFIFFPQPICTIAGLFMIVFQGMLIISGNLSWLNYITIVLCVPCFDDAFLRRIIPVTLRNPDPMGITRSMILAGLAILIATLSIRPIKNLFSRNQAMNRSYDPFHLVGTYGAFGSITKERHEIIIEGTNDDSKDPTAVWKPYEFKAKPGDIHRMPALVSPYHLRLDWLMWFAAMDSYHSHPWFQNLMIEILQGNPNVLGLMQTNPFPDHPPRYLRAEIYDYHFSTANERQQGIWWNRQYLGHYFPVISLRQNDTP